MKIASKKAKTGLVAGTALALISVMCYAARASATDAVPVLAPAPVMAATVPASAPQPAKPAAVAMAPAPAMMAAAEPAPPVSDAPMVVPSAPGGATHAKNLTALEDKVSESVKDVVKQLSSTDKINLDDLNTARQALAKLEVLIDIEKHMAELEKVRGERTNEKASNNLASVIPASALGGFPSAIAPYPMPAAPAPLRMPGQEAAAPYVPSVSRDDVTQIIGANGHYEAIVQGKTVHVGDSLMTGGTVIAISANEVDVKSKDGTLHHLKVKGVDTVYGHTL